MDGRILNFYYWDENHLDCYKRTIINYFETMQKQFEEIGGPQVVMEFNNFEKNSDNGLVGYLHVSDLGETTNKFEEICKYVLSMDRGFIPVSVSCENKKDYSMIETILKENYGAKGKLTSGFLGTSFLFNQRKIKDRNSFGRV